MKLLVCGPRDWQDYWGVDSYLTRKYNVKGIEIIAGDASGVDSFALFWANKYQKPKQMFEADWDAFGKAAGPMRNATMLSEGKPGRVLAFAYEGEPITKGTLDMVTQAVRAGVSVDFVRAPRT